MKRCTFLLIVWLCITTANAQSVLKINNQQDYDAYVLSHKTQVIDTLYLSANLNLKNSEMLFSLLKKQKARPAICLVETDLVTLPKSFYELRPSTLIIKDCAKLNYNELYKKLTEKNNLKELGLNTKGVNVLPPAGALLDKLSKLVITNYSPDVLKKIISRISTYPQIKELHLANNQIKEMPENFNRLKNLDMVDLSYNYINELPESVNKIKNIGLLNISYNSFNNLFDELSKLNGAQLGELICDNELNSDERNQLIKMLSTIKLNFIEPQTSTNRTNAKINLNNTVADAENTATILSDAYLLYPLFFGPIKNSFDSLLFEERYLNFSYINGSKLNKIDDSRMFKLYEQKNYGLSKNKDILFNLPDVAYLTQNYPELLNFNKCNWVYVGDLSRDEFVKLFLNRPLKDFRLEYNDETRLYEFTIKDTAEFKTFTANIKYDKEQSEESIERDNLNRIANYQKQLIKRAQVFNKKLAKEKYKYEAALKLRRDNAWRNIRTQMSTEERRMTHEEWLNYYDKIIAMESAYLKNAIANNIHFFKSLTLSGYTDKMMMGDGFTKVVPTFKDEEGNGLAVNKIYVVNNISKTFTKYMGTLNSVNNPIKINPAESCIVVELRNGRLAAIPNSEISSLTLRENIPLDFKLTIFQPETLIREVVDQLAIAK